MGNGLILSPSVDTLVDQCHLRTISEKIVKREGKKRAKKGLNEGERVAIVCSPEDICCPLVCRCSGLTKRLTDQNHHSASLFLPTYSLLEYASGEVHGDCCVVLPRNQQPKVCKKKSKYSRSHTYSEPTSHCRYLSRRRTGDTSSWLADYSY